MNERGVQILTRKMRSTLYGKQSLNFAINCENLSFKTFKKELIFGKSLGVWFLVGNAFLLTKRQSIDGGESLSILAQ